MSIAPRLHYFSLSGRGEFIKLILEEAGQKYEFLTHPPGVFKEILGEKLTFGQLPLYEEGNLELVQSGSILRYLAKKHGLYPSNLEESARAEMIVDGVFDLLGKYLQITAYRSASSISEADFVAKVLPEWFSYLEKALKKNKEGTEWIVSEFSFADLALFQVVDVVCKLPNATEVLKNYPALNGHRNRVAIRPNIKSYLNSDRRQ